jgi:transcriptional regulator with XRE-family HTH domain
VDINASKVRDHRMARGWTQQHLADACEVSLRTIQRVEKTGTAAFETVQALCAVLEVTVRDLSVVPEMEASAARPATLLEHRIALYIATMAGATLGAAAMFLILKV